MPGLFDLLKKLQSEGSLTPDELNDLQMHVDVLEGRADAGTHADSHATHHGSGTHFTVSTHVHSSFLKVISEDADVIEGLSD